jgi:hypothetical protein
MDLWQSIECHRLGIFTRSHAPELVVIHKSVQDRYLGMDVGRNKTSRRQPGWAFPAIGTPETPVLRLTRRQAYSGLRRDVYNNELGSVGTRKKLNSTCKQRKTALAYVANSPAYAAIVGMIASIRIYFQAQPSYLSNIQQKIFHLKLERNLLMLQ